MRLPDSPGQHHLHHLLWECYSGMLPVADAAFEGTDMTLPMAGTLDHIGLQPGATVADLSRVQPKTPQAISQLVAKLEKLGLIERRLGTGRGVGLYLTPSGEREWTDSIAREELIESRLRELLGGDAYDELRAALESARPGFQRSASPPAETKASIP